MTTDNFPFYLQNRLIQRGQTGSQPYSDHPPLVFPGLGGLESQWKKGVGPKGLEETRELSIKISEMI
jgi:hypothetical protein